MPSLQTALILRMPDRIYLPVRSTLLAGTHSISAPGEQPRDRESLARKATPVLGSRSPGAALVRQGQVRPILIQPGKPIVTDLRTLRLPSLLYLSEARLPAPPEPVVPGAKPRPDPAPRIAASTALHSPAPAQNATPTASPGLLDTIAKAIGIPAFPAPSAWSLVLHGDGAEGPPQAGTMVSGVDVSVLSIAAAVPKAGQVVEVPPVNQPAVAQRAGPSGSPPEPQAERHTATTAVNAAASSNLGTHNPPGEGARELHGETVARATSQAEARSGGSKSGGQAPAAVSGPVRSFGTPLGRVEVLDLPGGAQQWRFPPGGSFDVVIVQPSADATIPDAGRFLTGHPVQTVYIALGTGRDWVLQYCFTAPGSASSQSGMVVTLGPQPKLDAPFIQKALVPPQTLLRGIQPALFQAILDVNGRFAHLRPVADSNYSALMELLPYLEQWQFRPAKLDGVPTEVEVLLFVPSSTPQ
jgi:hypothetical protein